MKCLDSTAALLTATDQGQPGVLAMDEAILGF
jgi:hypothetical protein